MDTPTPTGWRNRASPTRTSSAAVLEEIAAERGRQISKGWTPAHDDTRDKGELAEMAGIIAADIEVTDMELDGPRAWAADVFLRHENDRRQQLVIAAALLVAEIERLDRANG